MQDRTGMKRRQSWQRAVERERRHLEVFKIDFWEAFRTLFRGTVCLISLGALFCALYYLIRVSELFLLVRDYYR